MDDRKDVALENLDRGFQESKNMQLLLFLNDQAEISNRLKTCRFKDNTNNNGVFSPDARVSTAPEAATRTHRLRPLSARPSTASGRQYQEPKVEREVDFDNVSVSGRRKSAVRRNSTEPVSSSSSPTPRPETVCGFYDLGDVEEESEADLYEIESDLDVISIESITSTGPCDDIDDDDVDGVTYEFDVPESDRPQVEAETQEQSGTNNISLMPVPAPSPPKVRHSPIGTVSPTRLTSPTRIKSSRHMTSVPNIGATSSNKVLTKSLPAEPHPPPSRLGFEPARIPESNSTSKVLRHMRARSSATDVKERGRVNALSKGFVWGDSSADDVSVSRPFRPPSDQTPLAATPISPRISFEEHPIEKQGVTLRTVARIDCDAAFYRKLRHRSAPAIRTEELATSRSEGNSPVRAKPVGIYHLPPLSKETSIPPSSSPHPGVRTVTTAEFLAQQGPQHKLVFQEPKILN